MQSAERFPAVVAEARTLSNHELQGLATRIAATIQAHPEYSQVPLTAVLGYRSPTAFAAVLAAPLAGNGYGPLNHTFPTERTEVRFECESRSIIVDTGSLSQLGKLLDRADQPLLVILPDELGTRAYGAQCVRRRLMWPCREASFAYTKIVLRASNCRSRSGLESQELHDIAVAMDYSWKC